MARFRPGSNIFDVTVGLPVPWLLYTMIFQTYMPVSSVGKSPFTEKMLKGHVSPIYSV